jgi:hypothetical protein
MLFVKFEFTTQKSELGRLRLMEPSEKHYIPRATSASTSPYFGRWSENPLSPPPEMSLARHNSFDSIPEMVNRPEKIYFMSVKNSKPNLDLQIQISDELDDAINIPPEERMLIRIGRSKNPGSRIAKIDYDGDFVGEPVAVQDAARIEQHLLHKYKLRRICGSGDYFRMSIASIEYELSFLKNFNIPHATKLDVYRVEAQLARAGVLVNIINGYNFHQYPELRFQYDHCILRACV